MHIKQAYVINAFNVHTCILFSTYTEVYDNTLYMTNTIYRSLFWE